MDEEKGERGDGGQELACFMYPISHESFSGICCFCRNMRGMLSMIHSAKVSASQSPDHGAILSVLFYSQLENTGSYRRSVVSCFPSLVRQHSSV